MSPIRPRTPPLDPGKLADVQRAMGDTVEGARELLDLFVGDALDRCRIARLALAKGDLRTVTRAAHALVGSSGTVGAKRLHTLARSLEDSQEEGQARLRLTRLEGELARVIDEAERLYGARGHSQAAPRTPLELPCAAGTSRVAT